MNIAITGGGTGGHLAIANALKEELNTRGLSPIFIGSQRGQDATWFQEDKGFEASYFLNSQGVVNKKGLKKLLVLKDIFATALQCKSIFQKHKIDAVFCVGGYSAAPASFASIMMRKPLYIHEQNAVMGSLNRVLKPFSKAFFSSYHEVSAVKDYPVRELYFQKRHTRTTCKTVIFLGGSQGAAFINKLAMESVPKLLEMGINVIHQTGANEYKKVSSFYKENNLNVECFDFSKNLIEYLQRADFAVSRAGASTLWELSANALPTLFVPFPYAAKNHQYYNAKVLVDKNLAFVKTQEELTPLLLLETIRSVDIKSVSEGLQQAIKAEGIKKISDIILQGE